MKSISERKKDVQKKIVLFKNFLYSMKELYCSSPITFTITFFIIMIQTFSSFALLYFSKTILESIEQVLKNGMETTQGLYTVGFWVALSVGVSVLLIFLNYLRDVLDQRQHLKFNQYVDDQMAKKAMGLDIAYFDNAKFYDTVTLAKDSKTNYYCIFYKGSMFLADFIAMAIAFVLAGQALNYWLPCMILLFSIPSFFTSGKFFYREFVYHNENRNLQRRGGYLWGVVCRKEPAKEIRFYDMKDFVLDRYEGIEKKYLSGLRRIILRNGLLDSICGILPMLGIALAMYAVLVRISSGQGGLGDFIYLFGLFENLKRSFVRLVQDVAKLEENTWSIERYRLFMAAESHLLPDGGKVLHSIETIEFDDVMFTYPLTDRPVLNHLSFTIGAKEKIAMVGINGAGKTTIIKLLLRFYDVDAGRIRINGADIRSYDLQSLRRAFSTVFQDFVIYSLSIRDNVAFSDYARRDDDEAIKKALRLANLESGLLDRIESLDTQINRDFDTDGIELSQGQRQKLAIARCAFRDAQLVILDEPTAALDPQAEHEILSQFEKLYADRGLLMISHRFSNTVMMDRILVVEDGRVQESGTHDELMKKEGRYAYLFGLQAEKYTVKGGVA